MQGHRFDIIEEYGCRPTTYFSIPAIFIVWIPPILLSIACLVFAGMSYGCQQSTKELIIFVSLYRPCPPTLHDTTHDVRCPSKFLKIGAHDFAILPTYADVHHANDLVVSCYLLYSLVYHDWHSYTHLGQLEACSFRLFARGSVPRNSSPSTSRKGVLLPVVVGPCIDDHIRRLLCVWT